MTNTLNTPIEALEFAFPMRVRRYSLRPGSGGDGLHNGGDGIVREIEFLAQSRVTVVAERRSARPVGPERRGRRRSGRRVSHQERHQERRACPVGSEDGADRGSLATSYGSKRPAAARGAIAASNMRSAEPPGPAIGRGRRPGAD